jgi:hypothetical protein
MNSDLVTVKSKTINNEAVPIVFKTVEVLQAGVADEREISRTYIFKNFQSIIPIKLAQILVKQNPQEFSIVKALDEVPSEKVQRIVRVAKEKRKGFVCEYCKKDDIKSKAGLKSHIRHAHPEKWEGKKPVIKK